MRIVVLDRDRCKKERCGYACMLYCPGLRMGEETIIKDAEGFPVISESLCTGCGICVKRCVGDALKVVNLVYETGKLIFQYGVNTFRLYNLPLPKNHSVVGLVGGNGMGKSTALKILSGKFLPNLGRYDMNVKLDDAIEQFRGMEIQNYLIKLKEGIKVSYKPQDISMIPEVFDGEVAELLGKLDERGIFEEAVSSFELEKCLERDIKSLSGGELQRIAICGAHMKNAEVYYFDEPSSYLDIKQRLKMVKNIKELAKNSSVIVVEHDLAVLDYLSDYIHIFYGSKGAYGIVSRLKSVRNGINEYLEGFLKEENIRFRESEIKFEESAPSENKSDVLFKYEEMEKSYPNFSLRCEGGEIKKCEIIGILGPNAIGKSTFVKLLAGVEKPTKGNVNHSLRISYKPQYVRAEEEGTVAEVINKKCVNKEVLLEIKKRLEIEQILEKEVKKLSGGELQLLAITLCLSQEADIYLLDEPSASLDVEQRIAFSETIKKVIERGEKSAFVVDHDVMLIDSVCHRLIVFEGVPSINGVAGEILNKRKGMNRFLMDVGITFRRDKDTSRPRVNKPNSTMDRKQKDIGEYYYV